MFPEVNCFTITVVTWQYREFIFVSLFVTWFLQLFCKHRERFVKYLLKTEGIHSLLIMVIQQERARELFQTHF